MKNKKFSLSIKIAFLVMIVSLIGIGVVSYFSYIQAKTIFINHTAELISKNIEQDKNELKNNISKLKYNVEILTYNPSTKGFFRSYLNPYKYDEKTNRTFADYINDISRIITLMMKQNPSYFQIRIIDKDGNEILKFIRKNSQIIKKKELQNKSHRLYFIQAISNNDIYISKINLNKEFNKLEFPIKPTIRVAKSIIENNKKVGIIIINANIKKLFNFSKLENKSNLRTYITNQKGDYLLNSKNPIKEFGFEFGRDYKIYYDYPELRAFYFSNQKSFSYIGKQYIIEARKIYFSPKRYIVIVKIAKTSIFKEKFQTYLNDLIIFIIIIVILIMLIATVLVKRLTKPIEKLTQIAKKIAATKGKKFTKIDIDTNDEIGELASAFSVMLDSLSKSRKEIENFASNLEKEVEKKTEELQKVNENLKHLVEEKVNEVRQKDKMLLQQSKMAAMGEMIGAISHQWRQPLNSLALNIQLLEDMAYNNDCEPEKIEEFVDKNMQTIRFMSQTIDDFRNFFRKDKEKVEFNVKEAVEKTLSLQKAQLQDHNIDVEVELDDINIIGFKNEFMQVILNLISNAKDAIEERREKEGDFKGKIYISVKKEDNGVIIKIKDNGGGIPKSVKERIFEPYFTTKDEGKGTGIGLYMVKEIVERMDGDIRFENIDDGVEFTITFGGG